MTEQLSHIGGHLDFPRSWLCEHHYNEHSSRHLFILLSSSLNKYSEVGLLDHLAVLLLIF